MSHDQRRRSIVALLSLSALGFRSHGAQAQAGRRPVRVGVVSAGALPDVEARMAVVSRALRGLGWIEGKDVVFEVRAGGNDPARLAAFARELVDMKVDALVTSSTPAALAAKAATRSIPVVFTMVSDPVESGVVASLARPGGNLTGWSNVLPESSRKLIEVLQEIVPGLKSVAVLYDANNPGKLLDLKEIQQARQGIEIQPVGLRAQKDIGAAFTVLARERVDGLVVLQDAVTFPHREEIVQLAAKHRMPAAYQIREYVNAGGLVSYGLNVNGQSQRTAAILDRILRGARPADLPVELPTHFELAVNLKAARAMGLTIPPTILVRADWVVK